MITLAVFIGKLEHKEVKQDLKDDSTQQGKLISFLAWECR